MINKRVNNGANHDESVALLDQLTKRHSGINLVSALVYEGFATERQAMKFAGVNW